MELIDKLFTEHPYYGSRRMTVVLQQRGYSINRKRVRRLMRLMGLETFYPRPNLSKGITGHKKYPYLLRNVRIVTKNQVWSTDITYIPIKGGFLYLVAIIDWFRRYVLSWELSNTMEIGFCLAALDTAFGFGQPEIW